MKLTKTRGQERLLRGLWIEDRGLWHLLPEEVLRYRTLNAGTWKKWNGRMAWARFSTPMSWRLTRASSTRAATLPRERAKPSASPWKSWRTRQPTTLGEQETRDDTRHAHGLAETEEGGDGAALMQVQWADLFTGHLHDLLAEFEGMSAGKAGRAAAFLQSMLKDMRRPAPHLRHPTLIERQNRLDALISVFAEDDSHLEEETRLWCLDKWKVLQPLLEGRVQSSTALREEDPNASVCQEIPRPSSATDMVETVEDSQDFAIEDGSRLQVVRSPDGNQRPLTQPERDQIEFDELVEEGAAEMEREEEARQWRLFAASEYRTWEEWAVSAELRGGPVKRARVQILVQGLGGRIVRDVNWLVPLRDGEQLSYAVRVQSANVQEDEDEEPHPEAASSTWQTPSLAPETTVDRDHGEAGGDGRSTLPVTGWESAPVMDMEEQELLAKDLDVATFVQRPLGIRFYKDWLEGKVTCRLIGQRFGYGVLGKFYAIRDESARLRQRRDVSEEEAEHLARAAMAEATAQIVEPGRGSELVSVEEGPGSLVEPAGDELLVPGLDPVEMATMAAPASAEEVPQADGLDSPAVRQRNDVHEQMVGVLDADEAVEPTAEGVVESAAASGSSTDGVFFSDVLANLDDMGAEVVAEGTGGLRSSGSGTSEGGSRQKDLSHWLK